MRKVVIGFHKCLFTARPKELGRGNDLNLKPTLVHAGVLMSDGEDRMGCLCPLAAQWAEADHDRNGDSDSCTRGWG